MLLVNDTDNRRNAVTVWSTVAPAFVEVHGDRLADLQAAVQAPWEEWLSQSRVSFDFYENQFGNRVERIYLSGGSSGLTDLKEKLKETIGLPVEEWNPLAVLASDSDPQQMKSAGPALAIALGLALRGAAA